MSIYNKKHTGLEPVDRNLNSIKQVNDFQLAKVDYKKVLLTDASLEAAFINIVTHNLGRKAAGVRPINSNVPVIINFDPATSTLTTMEITVTSDCIIDLEVF